MSKKDKPLVLVDADLMISVIGQLDELAGKLRRNFDKKTQKTKSKNNHKPWSSLIACIEEGLRKADEEDEDESS